VSAARALVGGAPAILDAGAQPGLDDHAARHRLAQRARKAGQRLRRPLRAARDQQPIGGGERWPDASAARTPSSVSASPSLSVWRRSST
jgi:hypothetical protein